MIYQYVGMGLFGAGVLAFLVMLLVGTRTNSGKLVKFCKNVSDFTSNVDGITDENLEQFDAACFTNKTPELIKQGWESFKGARFGYPSEFIEKETCLSGYNRSKYNKASFIVMFILFILSAGFFGYALYSGLGYIDFCAYAIVVFPWLILILTGLKPDRRARKYLEAALDDMDVSVRIQNYETYQLDTEGLDAIIDAINNVIFEEEHKPIPSKKDQLNMPEEPVYDETYEEEVSYEEDAVYEEEPAPKKPVDFPKFNSVLTQVIESKQDKATYLKIAKVMVVAFEKFKDDPEKVAELKNNIRKLIVAYKEAEA